MGLDFLKNYGGSRLGDYPPQPPLNDIDEEEREKKIDLEYETNGTPWAPQDLNMLDTWRPQNWNERPVRFVDGKNVGQTIATLRSPGGYIIPIRLAQVGSTSMRVTDGQCRREFEVVERVVSMIVDAFPWNEIESFALALQENGFRLLPVNPGGGLSYDFEKLRKSTDNRTMDEMELLEEAAIAQNSEVPTVIDGRLEPRIGGFDPAQSPVFGVIKSQQQNYLGIPEIQVLYQLEVGQRTPTFSIQERKLVVVSWYLRLSGTARTMPNYGIVRIEIPQIWFEANGKDWQFIDQLSRTIYLYRCRENSYGRAPVSLHPIVRAEESLGALFTPTSILANRFYRLTGL
jgi:hypothetical protein